MRRVVLAALALLAAPPPALAAPRPGVPALPEVEAPVALQTGAPPPSSALAGEGYVLIGDDKGVRVYRREKRAGVEIAAEGTLPASPERVRRALADYGNHGKWQKHLRENRILARGDGALTVYQRLKLPVIDDRDFTLQVTWGDDAGVAWMRFVTANDRGPAPVPGVVRVAHHEGAWRLEPAQGGGATHAVYRFHIDLAGSIPMWAVKGQAAGDLQEFFGNLGKQLPAYP